MIEQAELNQAFFTTYGKPSQAELFFPKALAKTEPSQASARTQHYKAKDPFAGFLANFLKWELQLSLTLVSTEILV